jgi:hypothetical protein
MSKGAWREIRNQATAEFGEILVPTLPLLADIEAVLGEDPILEPKGQRLNFVTLYHIVPEIPSDLS